jgi:hypothetical protein
LGSHAQHNTFRSSTPIFQGAAFRPFFIEDTAALGITAQPTINVSHGYMLNSYNLKTSPNSSAQIFYVSAKQLVTQRSKTMPDKPRANLHIATI